MRANFASRGLPVLATLAVLGSDVPMAEAARSSERDLGFTAGTCFDESEMTGPMATYVARVERALGGTRADQAAVNLTIMSEAAYAEEFAREIATYEAVCGGEASGNGCTGGINQENTVWVTCTFLGTSCTVVYQSVHPAGFWGYCD